MLQVWMIMNAVSMFHEIILTIVGIGKSLEVHFQCLSSGREGEVVFIITLWTYCMYA